MPTPYSYGRPKNKKGEFGSDETVSPDQKTYNKKKKELLMNALINNSAEPAGDSTQYHITKAPKPKTKTKKKRVPGRYGQGNYTT